ncbi:MAG: sigma-70 family RNA polymerase sigma factor [Holophagales bacterium]|nr:MAG: sigma-70 family RNA polymerase sigma factor [Holophagales bacterium]
MASGGAAPTDVTGLLQAWRSGDAQAAESLLARTYADLKRLAAAQLRRERSTHTLQATALVHETFLRLLGQQQVNWRDRAHFFGLAATMMRRILVDHARARLARKRQQPEAEGGLSITAGGIPAVDLLDLDRALTRFATEHPRQGRVVELRYFADLDIEEIGVCLDLSPATVKRDWAFARAWLKAELASTSSAT